MRCHVGGSSSSTGPSGAPCSSTRSASAAPTETARVFVRSTRSETSEVCGIPRCASTKPLAVVVEAAERVADPARRAAWLRFVVVGAGPTGVELAGALTEIARHALARDFRHIDPKQAQIIRAEADAEASRTYAASFGKDADFYEFYRAMQSYQTTFLGDGEKPPADTNIILSPQNDYLREFTGEGR